ncbi:MAG: S-methyl-5-thioribose-1-phosphate isomerase [Pseudolabrys sp.]|nr:S-methyl-5-thioribose-1-phosphate isomerase [Pseudolabrys sp.]
MNIDGKPTRTIWIETGGTSVGIIDQTQLPHRFVTVSLRSLEQTAHAIKSMQVRGAPLIGATAAYGVWLAMLADASDAGLARAYAALMVTRPTAINLKWALDEMMAALRHRPLTERPAAALTRADEIAEQDVDINRAIGRNGLMLIEQIAAAKKDGERINVLTHCNAGWLATVDWGTATAPIYMAHDKGIAIHVYADETRPRNQGASLTAWELGKHGVPHTVIPDNTGGHLMQHGLVDLVIVGTDRVTAQGDVCNKIGTYLKALAAHDNGVPFYVALPSPTIDFTVIDGLAEIPIEQRGPEEVTTMTGKTGDGRIETVQIVPDGSDVANYAFDVTPARLITALITERGVLKADREALAKAFPERARMIQKKPALDVIQGGAGYRTGSNTRERNTLE